ncbi:WD40 repeat domain-containing protein [Serratia ureilytica]
MAAIAPETEYSKTFYSIDISPDGRFIAAGSRDGYIYIWETSRLSPTKNNVEKDVSPRADAPLPKSSFFYWPTIINAHQQTVAQLKYLQNGDLLSLSWDGSLKLWLFSANNAAAPTNRTLLQFPRQLVSVATEPDEQTAYVTSEAGDILKVNLRVDRHPLGQFCLVLKLLRCLSTVKQTVSYSPYRRQG